jgi:hypothetical protein
MSRATVVCVLLAGAFATSGCGAGSGNSGGSQNSSPTATSTAKNSQLDPAAALVHAARIALVAHHRLSVRILWTNQVPARPQVVTGPALRALRQSAAGRKRRGIRVRLLHETFRVLSLHLDPSYTKATGIVDDKQTAALYQNGRRQQRSVQLHERARIELRRVAGSTRFVVWKVVLST